MSADRVHTFLLRNTGPIVRRAILRVFNISWAFGIFPDSWKLANITAILKPGKD